MRVTRLKIATLAWAVLAAARAPVCLGADLEPHMKSKVCGKDEIKCADVYTADSKDRLAVDASLSSSSPVQHINRIDVNTTATSSGNSGTLDSAGMGCLTYELKVTAVSGTDPKFQMSVEASENGTDWNIFTNTFRFTATGSYRHQRLALGAKYYRYSWVILGTSPSFTFTVTTTLKPYLPRRNVTITKYEDIAIDTLGAVSTVFNSADNVDITLFTIRSDDGGSTTQYKVQASNSNLPGTTGWVDVTGAISQGRDTTQLTEFANKTFRFYRIKITAAANVSNTLDLYWSGGG